MEDSRARWKAYPKELIPDDPLPEIGDGDALRTSVRKRTHDLREEIGRLVADVVTPTLRRQRALLVRLTADNEGSLSRLYALRQGAEESEK